MTPNLTEWTVVVVGQWNPYIFSPRWVSSQLLNVETLQTEVALGPGPSGVRYQTQNITLIPAPDRLIVGVRNSEDDSLGEMERTARQALQLLGHTPIQALGINFGFTESEVQEEILRTFNLPDAGALGDAGYTVQKTEIMRELTTRSDTLKLKMVYAEGLVRFHFNFHHPVSSADEASTRLEGRVLACRDLAMNLLADVFNLHGEELPQNGSREPRT